MRIACADLGSTFTKVALVDETGLLGTAEHRTTIETDVLDGLHACLDELGARDAEVIACSSAGGGLRIAVLGNEELVTAEAGRRVALSSGGKVVYVGSGPVRLADLDAAEPDVLLLTGGTDGGNAEVLLDNATTLRDTARPVVAAGDAQSRDQVSLALGSTPHVLADNVVPRIGVLRPESARVAIREMFLAHVIGGKHLSASPDFTSMVRGATPDVVLDGVELLADVAGTDCVVVDIGGATTDVHSVVDIDPEDATLAREVIAPTRVTRTVEGDLGMRWSAVTTVESAAGDPGAPVPASPDLLAAAERRRKDPGLLPDTPAETSYDEAIATLALTYAIRRHAGRSRVVLDERGRVVERTGRDLREVGVLVGSGGVLRHAEPGRAAAVLGSVVGPDRLGWQLPEEPRTAIDREYLLAPIGLLAERHPLMARALAERLLARVSQ